ncbi:secondary thiamine-phosphate synthase enzyme YjbQ [Candidatus Neomarinimicrobiota bacterium]
MITKMVKTDGRVQLVDITTLVREEIGRVNFSDGVVIVFVPHTTAGITINENADPDVPHDLLMELNKVIPFNDGYRHMEGNSAAHIKASLIGSSVQVMVEQGQLVLGTWQGIFFAEFDGPRQRKVLLKLMG